MINLIYKYFLIITVFSMASMSQKIGVHHKKIDQEYIVKNKIFNKKNYLKPIVELECEHETVCQDVKNYPELIAEKQINKLIQSGTILPESTKIVGLQRSTSRDICRQYRKKTLPRAARLNEESEWFFILNSANYPLYLYVSEKCGLPGVSCIDRTIKFKDNFRGVCKQEKAQLIWFAFDKIGDMPTPRNVSIDSWCSCSIETK